MRRLMLLRHAKALRAGGLEDFDRPLKASGRDQARQIGEFMAACRLQPGLALVSTALRARETFDLVDIFLHPPPERVDAPLIYEATADALFGIVRGLPGGQPSVLLVGHNPGFEELANELISTGDEAALARFHRQMPTGALAVIDFKAGRWGKIERRSGSLALFVTPAHASAEK
jgi:phosphohistidine phosphatase